MVPHAADWFERLTGFREREYAATRALLSLEGHTLVSRVNGARYGIGELQIPSLAELRAEKHSANGRRTTVRCLVADVRALHREPMFAGALFQVASQFNLLEMVSPDDTPEMGVTRYANDQTQGPACAIAAGAGTIYRNYFAPVLGHQGQTSDHQIDTLAPLGDALANLLACLPGDLWVMRNGYAFAKRRGLAAINEWIRDADEPARETVRGLLRIGLQRNVEVTDGDAVPRARVTQAYCSALPVAYSDIEAENWGPFAKLVLEAAYEATLRAAATQAASGGSSTVLLTRLGGGAFGNDDRWIDAAMMRGLRLVEQAGLDVCLVSYGSLHPSMRVLADAWVDRLTAMPPMHT